MIETRKRAVAYVRVSTAQQAQEGLSLVAQRSRIEAYCVSQGWDLAEVCHDAGISGKAMDNRPGLQKALGMLRAGVVDTLVVLRIDRLSRSLADFVSLLEESQRSDWALCSLSDHLDTSTPTGLLVCHILMALCEHERRLISARTTEGMAVLRSQGRVRGSVAPYGYRRGSDGKTLVEEPAERAAVAKIVALRSRRKAGFATIANVLNLCGYRARGSKWYPTTVRSVWLANKASA